MTNEKNSSFFLNLTVVYCICLIISNISAFKLVEIGTFVFPAAVFLFPVAYITNDILAEVYGYKKTKTVIWTGFLMNLIAVAFLWLSTMLPSPVFFSEGSGAYSAVLSSTPRMLAASLTAYLCGSFINAFVVSKLKIATKGKLLALRLILSTALGEGLDSLIFITIAFYGQMPFPNLLIMIGTQAIIKILYEIVLYPVTKAIINKIKKAENIDVVDTDIKNYNPFSLK